MFDPEKKMGLNQSAVARIQTVSFKTPLISILVFTVAGNAIRISTLSFQPYLISRQSLLYA